MLSLDNKDKLRYANWMPGSPSHMTSNQNKCGIMKWRSESNYHDATKVGQWTNTHCSNSQYPWVCSHKQSPEYPAATYTYPEKFSLPNVKCDQGWIPYHSACYKLFFIPRSFDVATEKCQSEAPSGAKVTTLLTLWDEYELQFGRTFLRDDQLPNRAPEDIPTGYWMGLQYGSDRGEEQWTWSDGLPLTRSDWEGAHPDLSVGKCAFMNNRGSYETSDCDTMRAFVCKAEFYDYHAYGWDEVDAALGTPIPCGDGWSLYGHHCNKIFTQELTYHEAQTDCNMQGGFLGSIHSNGLNRFMKELFTQSMVQARGMWIGMTYKGASRGWQWEDGSEVSYTNWDGGEPNNWNGRDEDCVEFLSIGPWNDELCKFVY